MELVPGISVFHPSALIPAVLKVSRLEGIREKETKRSVLITLSSLAG